MSHTETRSPLDRKCGHGGGISWPGDCTAAFSVVVTGVGLPRPRGQEVLRWKFRERRRPEIHAPSRRP